MSWLNNALKVNKRNLVEVEEVYFYIITFLNVFVGEE